MSNADFSAERGLESVLRLLRFHGIVLVNASGIPIEQMRTSVLSDAKTDAASVDVALALTFDPTANSDFSLKWKNDLRQNLLKAGVTK